MKQFTIVALRKDRKFLIEHLQDSSIAELKFSDEAAEGFKKIDLSSRSQVFERQKANAEKALKILDSVAPEKSSMLSSFSGRREIDPDEIGEFADRAAETVDLCTDIIDLEKSKTENAAERVRLRTQIDQLEPWENYDIPFSLKKTASTVIIAGSFPYLLSEKQLAEKLAKCDGLVFDSEIVCSSSDITCFVIFVPKKQEALADGFLRSEGFSYPAFQGNEEPEKLIEKYRQRLSDIEKEDKEADEKIASFADRREDIKFACDFFTIRADKYNAISKLDHSAHTFTVTGYIPEDDCEKLEEICRRLDMCEAEFEDADEEAPVKLKNNKFAQPAQAIVTMYASPGITDIDPTPILAFFYYFFFGMMFSDAGYGLLMFFACLIAKRKFRPERNMRNNLTLFEYCGISTTVWGLVYGSFFGNAPAVFYNHFTGANITMADICPWPILDQKNDAMTIMILSVALGLIHILVGMGCKFYVLWKNGDKKGALFDVGSWMLLLVGVAIAAAGAKLGKTVMNIGICIAVFCVAVLILTQGRNNKNIFKRLLSGVASLYDVTSYVSDLLSYSRLLALGLTTGVMAEVFNLLSEMLGKSFLGSILMIVVFIAGQAINIGLNALGSYVHTMRLQYVEMFSKFYEGGGKQFVPFTLNSKYIRIKEDNKK